MCQAGIISWVSITTNFSPINLGIWAVGAIEIARGSFSGQIDASEVPSAHDRSLGTQQRFGQDRGGSHQHKTRSKQRYPSDYPSSAVASWVDAVSYHIFDFSPARSRTHVRWHTFSGHYGTLPEVLAVARWCSQVGWLGYSEESP